MDFKEEKLLDGVEETTTSSVMNVEKYGTIGFQFTAAAIGTGNGVFKVQGTIDGSNWVDLNMLTDNATGETLTQVASKTLSTNSSVLVWLLIPSLKAIRAVVTVTTDGEYSCHAIAR